MQLPFPTMACLALPALPACISLSDRQQEAAADMAFSGTDTGEGGILTCTIQSLIYPLLWLAAMNYLNHANVREFHLCMHGSLGRFQAPSLQQALKSNAAACPIFGGQAICIPTTACLHLVAGRLLSLAPLRTRTPHPYLFLLASPPPHTLMFLTPPCLSSLLYLTCL